MPIYNDNGVPIIGREPQRVQLVRKILPLVMTDEEGSATCEPTDDMTPAEIWKLTLLIMYCVTQPQPFLDKSKNQIIEPYTPWRQYIADNNLERHFTFTLSIPLDQPGHA